MKAILFIANGGLGRNIMATAVARNIHEAYPDHRLYVSASHPGAFLGHPGVHKTSRLAGENLYESVVLEADEDLIVMDVEPYRDAKYIRGEEHLIEAWCRLCGVPCDKPVPEVTLYKTDLEKAKAFLMRFKRPTVLFQPFGGRNPNQDTIGAYYESRRGMHIRDLDLDVAKQIVAGVHKDFVVLHVKGPNQPHLANTMAVTADIREIMGLVSVVDCVMGIDSFLCHAAAAAGKKAIIAWCGTSSKKLGYADHKNFEVDVCPTPACHRPNSYFTDIMSNNKPWECPHEQPCTKHDPEGIIQSIMARKPKPPAKSKKQKKVEKVI